MTPNQHVLLVTCVLTRLLLSLITTLLALEQVVKYAQELFPESQRKTDPESNLDVALGDEVTGMYVDIHSSGGYVCEQFIFLLEHCPSLHDHHTTTLSVIV